MLGNLQLEQEVLGSLMQPGADPEMVNELSIAMFSDGGAQNVFTAIEALAKDGQQFTVADVFSWQNRTYGYGSTKCADPQTLVTWSIELGNITRLPVLVAALRNMYELNLLEEMIGKVYKDLNDPRQERHGKPDSPDGSPARHKRGVHQPGDECSEPDGTRHSTARRTSRDGQQQQRLRGGECRPHATLCTGRGRADVGTGTGQRDEPHGSARPLRHTDHCPVAAEPRRADGTPYHQPPARLGPDSRGSQLGMVIVAKNREGKLYEEVVRWVGRGTLYYEDDSYMQQLWDKVNAVTGKDDESKVSPPQHIQTTIDFTSLM